MTKARSERAPKVAVLEVELEAEDEGGDSSRLIDLVLDAKAEREAVEQAAEAKRAERRIDGVVIGRLVGLTDRGPRVDYAGCPTPGGLVARAASKPAEADVGRRVALLFEDGEPGLPILVGLIHHDEAGPKAPHPALGSLRIHEDGKRIEIECSKPIGLRCGEASITLTPKGRILLRGKYLLSRASVTNRIRGGSVRIN